MKRSWRQLYLLALAFYLLVVGLVYGYYISQGMQSVVPDLVYLLAPTLSWAAFGVAYQRVGPEGARGKILRRLMLGMYCFWMAEVLFFILKLYGLQPYPSVADVFFLGAYPFLATGMYAEYRLARVRLSSQRIPGLVGLTAVLVALVGYFNIYRAYDPTDTWAANVINSLYGVGDLVVLLLILQIGLVARGYKGGQLVFALRPMLAGFSLYLIADTLYAIFETQYSAGYSLVNLIDLIWIVGYLLIGYSAVAYLNVISRVRNLLSERFHLTF